ncbi:DUF3078 domain-containing protein [Flavobacterium sp.]|uniref:DUF3078 domain-containing protein n=1 Tax=Flavobacterium sp. TaxID=239 RepID=UPI0040487AF3
MKKFIVLLLFVSTCMLAQETPKDSTKHWTRKGVFTFLANQSSFSNWQAGGQNNFAGNIGFNYDFNYKNGDWQWDNKWIVAYGLTKIKGADTQKTDDRIELNSLLGKKASGYWFYSAFFNFKTQMDTGLDPATQTTKISHFFSPAFFQFGPGMLWKKSDNLKVNIAPATSKLIVVHDHFTEFGSSFGVEQGKTTRYELGAAINGYYKFILMENVSVENILNFYSNYLEDPQNVDIDYQLNIVMKINKFLSTNFAFQTIYDDNAFRGFQTKQIIGLGLNYGF